MMAGSKSPQRVPIINPSKGVRPMVWSMALPARMQDMLQPLPKWRVIRFGRGLPISSAARMATYRWLVPWKPYRRMWCFVYHS